MKQKTFKLSAVFAVVLALGLLLTSCEWLKDKDKNKGEKLDVVASIFPCYDFARAVAGDKADLSLLVKAGVDIHSYEPTLVDIAKVNSCDIFIYIGGESDTPWVERILANAEEDVTVVRLMDYVEAVEEEEKEGMQAEEEEGEEDGEEAEYDEHIWMSLSNAALLVDAIRDEMSELDSKNAAAYAENAAAYAAEIAALKTEFIKLVSASALKTIVVADRFPFRYLTDELGLDYRAALPGCSHDADNIDLSTQNYLIQFVKDNGVPCVFYVEAGSHALANTVAEAAGCQTALLHSCERPTQAEFAEGASYVTYMRQNLASLAKGMRN
ncbi:MAG: metal ABC transporter substrate-binding protein [Clostridiales bacterium]|jgi:zinc transport system substrate-binding protein|nr:metal ABC transporter substrate-binding protein [Clostridiales bacterium]